MTPQVAPEGTLTGGLGRPERFMAIVMVQKHGWVLRRRCGRANSRGKKALCSWRQLNSSACDGGGSP